jgi:hypothetical protein
MEQRENLVRFSQKSVNNDVNSNEAVRRNTEMMQSALAVLREKLHKKERFTADSLWDWLLESDQYPIRELGPMIGPCIRKASAMGWIEKTGEAALSERNNSNLIRVWKSKIERKASDSRTANKRMFVRENHSSLI